MVLKKLRFKTRSELSSESLRAGLSDWMELLAALTLVGWSEKWQSGLAILYFPGPDLHVLVKHCFTDIETFFSYFRLLTQKKTNFVLIFTTSIINQQG